MTVRPLKEHIAYIVILLVCVLLLDLILALQDGRETFPFLICENTLLLLVILRYAVTIGKTVAFSEIGCSVSFLCFHKLYRWSDLREKRLEDYNCAMSYKWKFSEGAFFSLKPLKRPQWMGPCEFAMLTHPFSSFFVTFETGEQCMKDSRYPIPYRVDKDIFLGLLSQWGIMLND